MVEIKSIILHLLPYIPFLSAAVIKVPGAPEISGIGAIATRLLEAGIVGGIIMYANVQVMEQKLIAIERNIERCEISEINFRGAIKELTREIHSNKTELHGIKTILEIERGK